jgi:hypothetical protein
VEGGGEGYLTQDNDIVEVDRFIKRKPEIQAGLFTKPLPQCRYAILALLQGLIEGKLFGQV